MPKLTMLSVQLKEAEERLEHLRVKSASQSALVATAATELTDQALGVVCMDVDAAYDGERQIEHELRRLQAMLQAHAYQQTQWLAMVGSVRDELKELGDVTNWAEVLEDMARDVRSLAKRIAALEKLSGNSQTSNHPTSGGLV